jgi:bacillithiol synthase
LNVVRVPLERLSAYPAIFPDLARRAPALVPFFPTLEGATVRDALDRASRSVLRAEIPRAAVADRLAAENAALGAGPRIVESARAIADPETVVVAAGQQPGLFVGPLLTVYKAVTAIRIAAEIEKSGRRAVPVFWCHTDDHDLDEANQLHVSTREFEVRRLRAVWEATGEPLYARHVDDALRAVVEEARSTFPPTPRRDEAFALLGPTEGDSLGSWFGRAMLRLFDGLPLVMLEPRWLRRESASLLAAAARLDRSAADSIRARGEALRRAGYAPGLVEATAPFLFREDDSGRRRRVTDAPGRDLAEDVTRAPERYSADVALRPVLQSALLPCAAIVVGPSEAAYVAQLGGLFEALGVPMPFVAPRLTATLIEERVDAARRAFGIEHERLATLPGEMPEGDGMPREARASFESARSSVEREMARATEALRAVSESAATGLENALAGVFERLGQIERRAEDAFREGSGRGRSQWRRLHASVRPRDLPQERVFGPLPFVVRYRTDWLREIVDSPQISPIEDAHAFVHVSASSSDSKTERNP